MSHRRMPKAARIHLLRLYERLARPVMFATVSPAKRTHADEEIAALLDKLSPRCVVLPPGLKIEIQAPRFGPVRVVAGKGGRKRGVRGLVPPPKVVEWSRPLGIALNSAPKGGRVDVLVTDIATARLRPTWTPARPYAPGEVVAANGIPRRVVAAGGSSPLTRSEIKAAVQGIRDDYAADVPMAQSYERFMRRMGLDPRRPM